MVNFPSLSLSFFFFFFFFLPSPNTVSGKCTYPSIVTLDSNLACRGKECDVDTVTVLKMAFDIHYEYIRQPCVEMSFMNNALKVKHAWGTFVCGNPKSALGAPACTETVYDKWGNAQVRWWRASNPCEYVGERVTYDTAVARCAALNRTVEPVSNMLTDWSDDNYCDLYNWYAWTSDPCHTNMRINFESGKVALTHEVASSIPEYGTNERYKANGLVSEKGVTWFRVAWEGGVGPAEETVCASPCSVAQDGTCLCATTMVETPVFTSQPADLSTVSSSNLFIGAPNPDMFDAGKYVAGSWIDGGLTVNFWYPSGESVASKETIFQVVEKKITKYYKNVLQTVSVDISGTTFSFRNAPHFNSLFDADLRDAHYETDALLDHLFLHDNTGPFVSYRLIQRFGISNPSPRYMEAVTTAFAEGEYTSGGVNFGNGEYGNLEATVAAILLDREASPLLDADPTVGSLKEPLLRVLHFFRSMEYKSDYPLLLLDNMDTKIGQEAHNIPTVFSYFLPEYAPPGAIATAGLTAPEAYVANTPKALGLISGFFSLSKYGLVSCDGGFHEYAGSSACNSNSRDPRDYAYGKLGFTPASYDPSVVVDELALLLAPGRLEEGNKQTIVKALEESVSTDSEDVLSVAQQLMAITPEFHTTNVVRSKDELRSQPGDVPPPTREYKAIVYYMLSGGADTFNLLVPHSGCSPVDMFAQYVSIRKNISLTKDQLHQIDASGSGQQCSSFGVHPSMKVLADLYTDRDAAFFANTGVLFQPSTKGNYRKKNPTQLFAHNVMQKETKVDDPYQKVAGTGVLGRMIGALNLKGYEVTGISLANQADVVVGENGVSPAAITLNPRGADEFNPNPSFENMTNIIGELNKKGKSTNSLYGETWSSVFINAITENERIKKALESPESDLMTDWGSTNGIERQLQMAARLIRASSSSFRNVERDVFYVELGGWDTHSDVLERLESRMSLVSASIEKFTAEMKAQGHFDQVTTVIASEFARTLTPNSGEGSDHAWGGNYFMFGGDVRGGRIHGEYPTDLRRSGPYGLGNGRILPTSSWDHVWNGVSEWFGVEPEDLDYVVPNRPNWAEGELWTKEQMFN